MEPPFSVQSPNGFQTHNLTLHPFLWSEKVPFEVELIAFN